MQFFSGDRVRAGDQTWKFFEKNIFCHSHLPSMIPKMSVSPAAKNIFGHSLNKQEYAKLESNRKKLKSVLRVRFHDRLDTESDMAIESFRASCVSMQLPINYIIAAKLNPSLEKSGNNNAQMFWRRIWMSY